MTPGGDMFATGVEGRVPRFEVHSPHLPAARELLERPLLHSGPQDLRRAASLRAKIGDPAVRDALDVLAAHLEDRFAGDIELGTGPAAAGGPTDVALSRYPNPLEHKGNA
ncbi:hypothetical protein [Actinomadura sp. 9N215]|uniref:hypothetical protein n=1 Tax=Actinomadura sp. 9N215 TaxID=3375150 RepID=UPI003791B554